MNYQLKDYLNSINQNKENLMDQDASAEKKYPAYIVNKCMSHHIDTVMHANEMNRWSNLPSKLQYDFFTNTVRPKKRFSPWDKKDKIEDLETVQKYYGYSVEKARQAITILSRDQIDYIKDKMNTGGHNERHERRQGDSMD
ncbi:clamp loader subunit [Synechococcus phage ACG-2014d]|uniref:Clamp loader subunit n=1 Tax=Synechococcus phage ACG-2014d TaxID=1493509 RepID=A0A0E3I6G7_9CAUD|nr:clamp loader subunit [Synechococcus phage ACG-2014d]